MVYVKYFCGRKKSRESGFLLFLLLVDSVFLSNRIELFELKFFVSVFLLVLSCVVGMTFTDSFRVAHSDEFYKFVLRHSETIIAKMQSKVNLKFSCATRASRGWHKKHYENKYLKLFPPETMSIAESQVPAYFCAMN